MREEEDFVLQALVVRKKKDSLSHLGELIIAQELLFGHDPDYHVDGRPLATPPAIRKLHLSLYERQQENV